MAKIVKWCTLFVCLTLFTSTSADAVQRSNMLEGEFTPTTIEQYHSHENTLCALICGFFNGGCEISQMNFHLSFDSKSYLKLLIHPKSNRVHSPISDSGINFNPDSISPQFEGTEYYVYALRKIII